MTIFEGTAGWSIPRSLAGEFPEQGSALSRYAARLAVVEINSSFHRPHRISTWERWRDSVPSTFRFSAKFPKTITHDAKLRDCSALLDGFIPQVEALAEKLAVLLVQLPPKLEFDRSLARRFFREVRARSAAKIACEPRNASWFTPEADQVLQEEEVARVAADPAICETAAAPGGWKGLSYWRLHGSPVIYRSSYSNRIPQLAESILASSAGVRDTWVLFDNTASAAAMRDALDFGRTIREICLEDGC